ncbi:MAG TPA: hypothetical protein VEY70_24680 [Metabacillus sp.]|nr:hypothetical protein [Metabacillus sp.]
MDKLTRRTDLVISAGLTGALGSRKETTNAAHDMGVLVGRIPLSTTYRCCIGEYK